MKTRAGKFLPVVSGFVLAEFLVGVFIPQDKMVMWIEMHSRGFMMNQPEIDAIHHFNDRELRYHFNEIGLRGEESVQEYKTNIPIAWRLIYLWFASERGRYLWIHSSKHFA